MITLVLGGTRSGKSGIAEQLVARAAAVASGTAGPTTPGGAPAAAPDTAGPTSVVYLATGAAVDDDMAERIAAHRARRPAHWITLEVGTDLPAALASRCEPALVDSLGTWVAASPDLAPDIDRLVDALRARRAPTVLVSEEVGLGVHPVTEAGRRFADAVGEVNQAVAAVADEVLLVVAGRALTLPPAQNP